MKTLFILLGALIPSLNGEEMLKLVNTKTETLIVSFSGDKVEIHHPILAKELNHSGVYIPPIFKEKFEGKRVVFPDDPLFQKAFIEVYYPLVMADGEYQWVQEND